MWKCWCPFRMTALAAGAGLGRYSSQPLWSCALLLWKRASRILFDPRATTKTIPFPSHSLAHPAHHKHSKLSFYFLTLSNGPEHPHTAPASIFRGWGECDSSVCVCGSSHQNSTLPYPKPSNILPPSQNLTSTSNSLPQLLSPSHLNLYKDTMGELRVRKRAHLKPMTQNHPWPQASPPSFLRFLSTVTITRTRWFYHTSHKVSRVHKLHPERWKKLYSRHHWPHIQRQKANLKLNE